MVGLAAPHAANDVNGAADDERPEYYQQADEANGGGFHGLGVHAVGDLAHECRQLAPGDIVRPVHRPGPDHHHPFTD